MALASRTLGCDILVASSCVDRPPSAVAVDAARSSVAVAFALLDSRVFVAVARVGEGRVAADIVDTPP